ncbi:MAG TPA: winged helix-turn-helix domain-containing protein, partial [Mycobacteriales bacterium]|nr:winged helix-turn-helix domain-containing protein [Mycobacteriales bacterium]
MSTRPEVIVSEPSASPRFRVAVLGPLRVWRDDAEVGLGPVRQQAFFAAMVLRPNIAVSQRELLEDVWGLERPGTGAKVIPGYVYRLRKCLHVVGGDISDGLISSDRYGYRFSSRDTWMDSAQM